MLSKRVVGILLAVGVVSGCSFTEDVAKPQSQQATVQPLPVRKPVESPKHYVVQQGDSLYSIGFRLGLSYRQLAEWNNLAPPYKLTPGQKLRLFKPKQWVIKKSQEFGRSVIVEKEDELSEKKSTISNNNKKVLKLYWQWPLTGSVIKNYLQTDGKGIDIQAVVGQTVKAAASGTVVYDGDGLPGYDGLLIVKHDEEYLSAYAHNAKLLVKEGDMVKAGQAIAEIGDMGNKQLFLHFEIRKNGNPVNPLDYLPESR